MHLFRSRTHTHTRPAFLRALASTSFPSCPSPVARRPFSAHCNASLFFPAARPRRALTGEKQKCIHTAHKETIVRILLIINLRRVFVYSQLSHIEKYQRRKRNSGAKKANAAARTRNTNETEEQCSRKQLYHFVRGSDVGSSHRMPKNGRKNAQPPHALPLLHEVQDVNSTVAPTCTFNYAGIERAAAALNMQKPFCTLHVSTRDSGSQPAAVARRPIFARARKSHFPRIRASEGPLDPVSDSRVNRRCK